MTDIKKQGQEQKPSRDAPRETKRGLEGAEQEGGVFRREGVEGGEDVSIGGSPPSPAGGTRSPAPTRDDPSEP